MSHDTDAATFQIGFYKTFGRPIAKVFLGAVFTYQAVYWLWVKMETDELRMEKEGMSACLVRWWSKGRKLTE